eukprot:jgi/Ulvmu1/5900/UM026_0021.1
MSTWLAGASNARSTHARHGVFVTSGNPCITCCNTIQILVRQPQGCRVSFVMCSAETPGSKHPAARFVRVQMQLSPAVLAVVAKHAGLTDSKSFVDMPIVGPVKDACDAILRCTDSQAMAQVLTCMFDPPGTDLDRCRPSDWSELPEEVLQAIACPVSRQLAVDVHAIWPHLCRKVNVKAGTTSTLLPLPYETIICGERFRETYYWDSYWILKGLLACGMTSTAKATLLNLMHVIEQYGFVPNGCRVYYLNRSQPPLFASMVNLFVDRCQPSSDFKTRALTCITTEYEYWTSGCKGCSIIDSDGISHELSRYYVNWPGPRPESFKEDTVLAEQLPDASQHVDLFRNIASAAESGWDFSSRWCADEQNLVTIRTTDIVPIDLNVYMWTIEDVACKLCVALNDKDSEAVWSSRAIARIRSIHRLMWHAPSKCWTDLLLVAHNEPGDALKFRCTQLHRVHACSWLPYLWGQPLPEACTVEDVIDAMIKSGLVCAGGLATTSVQTMQQWDASSSWAPLICTWVDGLHKCASAQGRQLGQLIGKTFLTAVHRGMSKSGCVWEKYNTAVCGDRGHGGEYETQMGFGWTNGTVLHFLLDLGLTVKA